MVSQLLHLGGTGKITAPNLNQTFESDGTVVSYSIS
jgi:hypothetical protein